MKKLFFVCAVLALLTCGAGAADVGTINNEYPGDTEAQAQLLYELGLFRGTDQGFALDKPMSRAQAAVMLTRLLGEETTATEGDWTHPFTDVPQWADHYVGWLYRNGLTKGVSDTRYGASSPVTCAQYCTFLSRVVGYQDYSDLLYEDEQEQCDAAGFVRGDAVSLSVRLLRCVDDSSGAEQRGTLAQTLLARGVFSAEQLDEAARDVLPCTYWVLDEPEENTLCFTTCDVILWSVRLDSEAHVLRNEQGLGCYLLVGADGQAKTLYRVEWGTSQLTPLYTDSESNTLDWLYRCGQTTYFTAKTWSETQPDRTQLLLLTGDTVQPTGITLEGSWDLREWMGGTLLLGQTQSFLLTEDGAKPTALYGQIYTERENGVLVTQSITTERTELCTWTADGAPIDAVTILNDALAYPGENVFSHTVYAPQLSGSNSEYLWGSAGLYREQNGTLTQLTNLPAYDYSYDPSDGSYVIVTHDTGRYVDYSESAVSARTGDTLVRIRADGTAETLLPTLPEGSLLLGTVSVQADGSVAFTEMTPTEPHLMGRYTCVLRDGKITVTEATADILYIYGEDAVAKEQERLRELGVGA